MTGNPGGTHRLPVSSSAWDSLGEETLENFCGDQSLDGPVLLLRLGYDLFEVMPVSRAFGPREGNNRSLNLSEGFSITLAITIPKPIEPPK